MGVVYRARQVTLNRLVALKMILAGPHAGPEELARFRTEAEAVAQLQHPQIVQVYEIGEAEGRAYFSLEFVEGGSLAGQLHGAPLPARRAAQLVEVLARAIHFAHQHGIIHRDLKPANVLLTAEGQPKITDFGLAKKLEGGTGQTRSGDVMGTPSYMAPEQAQGKLAHIGPGVDVYALGAILYELLSGRPPFRAESAWETITQVMTEEPLPPTRLYSKLPRDLETICLKCLRKERDQRYPSAQALADDLHRFLEGEPIQARPIPPWERALKWAKRRPAVAALLTVTCVAVAVVAAGVLWYNQRLRETEAATRAAALVEALAWTEARGVPRLVEDLSAYRRWADPLLRQRLQAAADGSREQLHTRLALLPVDASQVDYLTQRLLQANPDEVPVLREALRSHQREIEERLWGVLTDDRVPADQRLRAACALALYDPTAPRWKQVQRALVDKLLAENPLLVGQWEQALRPVASNLVVPLTEAFAEVRRPESERFLAVNLLTEYAANQPELLAELLKDADRRSFAVLMTQLHKHGSAVVALLEKELQRTLAPVWPDPALHPAWGQPEPAVVEEIERAHGFLAERFALCQTMPLDRCLGVAERLRRCGYRPIRFRPYAVGPAVQVAVVWTRDGQDWHLVRDRSADEVQRVDAQMQARGWAAVDVAGYAGSTAGSDTTTRYAALWSLAEPASETRLSLGIPSREWAQSVATFKTTGFMPRTNQVGSDRDTQPRYSGVWWKPKQKPLLWYLTWGSELGSSQENSFPALLKVDVAVYPAPQPSGAFLAQLLRGKADLHSASVWNSNAEREAQESHRLEPARHLERCRAFVAGGYRPAALSVVPRSGDGALVAGSVWHRPIIAEAAKDAHAKRQAQAAVGLLQLGRAEQVWPLLQQSPEPRLRTYLIHRIGALGTNSQIVLKRWEEEREVSVRRALLLCLGEFGEAGLPSGARQTLIARLRDVYRQDPDPGIHSAAEWLLRRWGSEAELRQIDDQLAGQPPRARHWYRNRHQDTLVVIPGPVEFWMGTPDQEPEKFAEERLHRRRIPRSFALATKEVTVQQFKEFLRANPSIPHSYAAHLSPDDHGPILSVSWFEAAQYCRWLSEQEGVPPEEMCYPTVKDIKEGMKLGADHLSKTGYRLPTEAEWEYACRAEATTSRAYGRAEELLSHYAWHLSNSGSHAWPVGRLKPNDLGLFDMCGNALEWTYNRHVKYDLGKPEGGQALEDKEEIPDSIDAASRVLRGGAFTSMARYVRSAVRNNMYPPATRVQLNGFRVARTCR
ncbi:MAG: bifunctional serine/threonine-protein kinase/formylglycine-generating enzyme family protein [Gemmataceae bacterium]|nr:bifunctional serine/threonine-protein kinase/formylglycine-generating enzyme family protein [Gemmataceae bacterium]